MGRILRKKPAAKKKKAAGPEEGAEQAVVVKKTPPAPAAPKAGNGAPVMKAPGFWTNSIQFLREVKVELKKVTWPSRKQTIGSTLVVLILVAVVAGFLGLTDSVLTWSVQWILR